MCIEKLTNFVDPNLIILTNKIYDMYLTSCLNPSLMTLKFSTFQYCASEISIKKYLFESY